MLEGARMKSLSSKEMPEWFALSNYQDASQMKLGGWYLSFIYRALFFDRSDERLEKSRDRIYDHLNDPLPQSLINQVDFSTALGIDLKSSPHNLETTTVKSLQALVLTS